MKANRKRIRLMRSVAIASCVAGLAAPSMAGAMPLPPDPHSSASNPAPASTAPVTGGRTIAVSHENGATVRVAKSTDFGADSVSSQSKTISSASGPAMTPAGSKYAQRVGGLHAQPVERGLRPAGDSHDRRSVLTAG